MKYIVATAFGILKTTDNLKVAESTAELARDTGRYYMVEIRELEGEVEKTLKIYL